MTKRSRMPVNILQVVVGAGLLATLAPVALAREVPVIVGGTVANSGAWPWQIELQRQGSFICGGSLINSEWIVTAAHCVTIDAGAGWTVRPASQFTVRAGHNTRSIPGANLQLFDVESIVVHPSYDASLLTNDVALVKLDGAAVFTDYVKPIRPATSSPTPGSRGVSSGWGRVAGGAATSDALLQATLPIEESDDYSDHFADLWGAPGFELDASMLCAGRATGEVGICNGDSGGPLISPRAEGGSGWELVGVSSWVSGAPVPCGSYSVFTRVSSFASWIESEAGPTPLLGDIDGDGCVDDEDMELLLAVYGSPPPSASYDINSDGAVGYMDYLAVLRSWGSCH